MSNIITVNCPYCMEEKLISAKGLDEKLHLCQGCKRHYKKKDAVTEFNKPESQIKIKHLRSYSLFYIAPVLLTWVFCQYIATHVNDIAAPEFLAMYIMILKFYAFYKAQIV